MDSKLKDQLLHFYIPSAATLGILYTIYSDKFLLDKIEKLPGTGYRDEGTFKNEITFKTISGIYGTIIGAGLGIITYKLFKNKTKMKDYMPTVIGSSMLAGFVFGFGFINPKKDEVNNNGNR